MALTLGALAALLELPPPTRADVVVAGASIDSREVSPGDLYAALPGARVHGARFAAEAAARGAVAALSDQPCTGLPTLIVPDPRRVLGALAARIHGDPSRSLRLFGVTGTNGKTSTAHLLEAGLAAAGRRAGLLSSVVTRGAGRSRPSRRTTPEATELQAALARLRDDGVTDVAVEASSHGLELGRLDATCFAVGVFTNLSRDHLDLHGSMENYYAAKASLFDPRRCGAAVVSIDDAAGRRLAGETRCPVTTFSAAGRPEAHWRADEVRATSEGTTFRLRGPGVDRTVGLRLLGPHQVDNATGAIAALATAGVDLDLAIGGLQDLSSVPGRLERVDVGAPFTALVDYAHNPGAAARVLPYVRSLTRGRLIVVLGAAGERDHGKRHLLALAAATAADLVVVTDESPYREDPAAIRADLAATVDRVGGAELLVVPDRAAAFAAAVAAAGPGDTVFVGGRGHEQQLVGARGSTPFDEVAELRAAVLGRDLDQQDYRQAS